MLTFKLTPYTHIFLEYKASIIRGSKSVFAMLFGPILLFVVKQKQFYFKISISTHSILYILWLLSSCTFNSRTNRSWNIFIFYLIYKIELHYWCKINIGRCFQDMLHMLSALEKISLSLKIRFKNTLYYY